MQKAKSPTKNFSPSRRANKKSQSSASKTTSFLLEIGTEELPSQFIKPALDSLATLMKHLFHDQRISHGDIQILGTPRRLAVVVNELDPRQSSVNLEVFGPPTSAAYDASGQPTQAAKGFAKAQGLAVEQLQTSETPKGPYVCAVTHQSGKLTKDVLRENIPQLLQQLSFPKSMRWNVTKVRFARPIRWIVALDDNRVITCHFGGVSAGARTWGHRFLCPPQFRRGIDLKYSTNYVSMLRRAGVVVDQHERRTLIEEQLHSLADSAGARVYGDNLEELLEQAVFSVEGPRAILGHFNAEFLMLPQEILITAMKEHQGFFSLVGKNKKLLPLFIAVTNMKLKNMDLIRSGNERVLAARLNDAQYFFEDDRNIKLVDRVSRLKDVVFHQKLGSLFQKTERVCELIVTIADTTGHTGEREVCQRAAYLSKADLTTGMVGEFPTLQGLMGQEYAKCDGESEDVCLAIGEQYYPRTPEDALPPTLPGTYLSLADRLDTLAAFFRVGMVPSGSEDPFGLRRLAYGVVRIITEGKLRINLTKMIDSADRLMTAQGVEIVKGVPRHDGKLSNVGSEGAIGFILERLRYYARTVHGLREDIMEAVLACRKSDECDVLDLMLRMLAMQSVVTNPTFDPLVVGFKRAHRLVEKEQWSDDKIQEDLFQHQSEKTLFQTLCKARSVIVNLMERQEYHSAFSILLELKSPIDDFFVGVLVNASEQNVRANRLSLLCAIDRLFLQVADFSRLQSTGG